MGSFGFESSVLIFAVMTRETRSSKGTRKLVGGEEEASSDRFGSGTVDEGFSIDGVMDSGEIVSKVASGFGSIG